MIPICGADLLLERPLSVPEFQKQTLSRQPDWRNLRANAIAGSHGADRGLHDDALTLQLARLIKVERGRMLFPGREFLKSSNCLLAAYKLITDPAYQLLKREVELRVLARQPASEIGELVGLPVGIVELYERIGFDVRDRLDCLPYIFSMAIGEEPTRQAALKKLAYRLGPSVIDLLMIVLQRGVAREDATTESIENSILAEPELKRLLDDARQPIGRKVRELVGLEKPSAAAPPEVKCIDVADHEAVKSGSIAARQRLAG